MRGESAWVMHVGPGGLGGRFLRVCLLAQAILNQKVDVSIFRDTGNPQGRPFPLVLWHVVLCCVHSLTLGHRIFQTYTEAQRMGQWLLGASIKQVTSPVLMPPWVPPSPPVPRGSQVGPDTKSLLTEQVFDVSWVR